MLSLLKSQRNSGFTLIEICVAVAILGLTVASSITALGIGYAMLESARDNTLASQILQSEMENLRLMNWEKISELEDGEFEIEASFQAVAAHRFSCFRTVVEEESKPGFREITLEVQWTTARGNVSTRRYVSYFSRTGLNDYYYRAFR